MEVLVVASQAVTGTEARWVTFAELWQDGRVTRRYPLKHDERGYYFEGLECASWRRKTREAVERRAARSHFDVIERCIEPATPEVGRG